METILALFKLDLGISITSRDEYYMNIISGCRSELEGKGIALDLAETEDMMLLLDYALWRYKKRNEDAGIPEHLRLRIMNKKLKGRVAYEQTM